MLESILGWIPKRDFDKKKKINTAYPLTYKVLQGSAFKTGKGIKIDFQSLSLNQGGDLYLWEDTCSRRLTQSDTGLYSNVFTLQQCIWDTSWPMNRSMSRSFWIEKNWPPGESSLRRSVIVRMGSGKEKCIPIIWVVAPLMGEKMSKNHHSVQASGVLTHLGRGVPSDVIMRESQYADFPRLWSIHMASGIWRLWDFGWEKDSNTNYRVTRSWITETLLSWGDLPLELWSRRGLETEAILSVSWSCVLCIRAKDLSC